MIVIDSSALIAILRREPEADTFLWLLADADGSLLSAVSLLETSAIEIVPLDAALTELARSALLRYGKGRHRAGLNFGDCATYALASSRNLPLLSKGDDFPHTDLRLAA